MSRDRMATLKFVDHWLGLPLCWLLGLAASVASIGRRRVLKLPARAVPRCIVISKFFGLGSIVLSGGLVRALRERYPESRIVFLTLDGNLSLLGRLSGHDGVVSVSLRSPAAFVHSTASVLWSFLRHRPDVFIDLEFYSKFATAMAFLSGARWRIGFHLPAFWRCALINVPVYFNTAAYPGYLRDGGRGGRGAGNGSPAFAHRRVRR